MRKTTRLELAFVCYLLTFCISNVLVARVNGNPTKSIVTLDATNENHLIQNVIPIAFDLNETLPINEFTLTDASVITDERINTNTTVKSTKTPGRHVSVGQDFFIDTILDDELSKFESLSVRGVTFKNSPRVFLREQEDLFVFHGQETKEKSANKEEDTREKIRISFKSPKGYQRQLLVGTDPNATNGFDIGYDALMNEYNSEDMFWIIGNNEFVIQGVSNFEPEQILPIGIVVDKKGEIIIQLDSVKNIDAKKSIYLKDKWNNITHDLRKEKFISTSEAGYFLDRFELVFFKENEPNQDEEANGNLGIVPVEDPKIEVPEMSIRYAHLWNEIQILNPNEEIIDDLRLYKMDGVLLHSFGSIPNSKEIILPIENYSSGVYIAKCFMQNKIISQKFICID